MTRRLALPTVDGLRARLRHRYALRLHGFAIGTTTLCTSWLTSHLLMLAGLASLGWRYVFALSAGYAAYLLLVRLWARQLLDGHEPDANVSDVVDATADAVANWRSAPRPSMHSDEGGDFGGAGASGDFGEAIGNAGELAGTVLEGAASADEGIVVVVPLAALAFVASLLALVIGGMLMMFFGIEVLLAVAVELAFAYAAGRSAVLMAREGWLGAAWRLTWKPLLAILLAVYALGWTVNHFVPQAQSLPQAVSLWRGR